MSELETTETKVTLSTISSKLLNKNYIKNTTKTLMSDVVRLDIMNLAGFCRNCISRWYQESSLELEEEVSKDEARELIYGMPHNEWKEKYQK